MYKHIGLNISVYISQTWHYVGSTISHSQKAKIPSPFSFSMNLFLPLSHLADWLKLAEGLGLYSQSSDKEHMIIDSSQQGSSQHVADNYQ